MASGCTERAGQQGQCDALDNVLSVKMNVEVRALGGDSSLHKTCCH